METRKLLPLVMAVSLETALSCLLSISLGAFDKELGSRLLTAFGATALPSALNADWLTVAGAFNLAGIALTATATTFVAWRLPCAPRVLATSSLLAMCLLYQWAIAQWAHAMPHALAFLMALASGFVGGLQLRALADRRRREESHYYELKLKNKELLDARLTLLKQDEVERRTLAADLHDQVLNDLKQISQRFEQHCRQADQENSQAITRLLNQVMAEIREVMDSLSPSVLEHLGLPAALEDCLRMGAQRADYKVRFKNGADSATLDLLSPVEQGLLYRLAQESITNICKHAQASVVRLQITAEQGKTLSITICDDGKGMTAAQRQAGSRGLKYMRYRAELINATVNWQPGDGGKGTTVEIRLDLSQREATEQNA